MVLHVGKKLEIAYHYSKIAVFWIKCLTVLLIIVTSINVGLAIGLATCVISPERILTSQTFLINYREMSRTTPTYLLNQEDRVTGLQSVKKDPNWDGVLTGGSMGVFVGHYFPFAVGYIIFPVAGMLAGYQIDTRF